jgi:putative endopeptidase
LKFKTWLFNGVLAGAALAIVGGSSQALAASAGKAKFGTWGYDATSMDASVKPGDDFFKYVNGAWDKRTEIAADRTSAGVDVVLTDEAERQVREIVERLAKDPAKAGPGGRRVGDLYAVWMDETGIEARGTAPLKPYLAKIAAVKTKAEVAELFATRGYTSPVGIGITPDLDDPNRYVATVGQGGLGMPNRDYYLRDGAKFDAFRKAYRDYVIKIQTLAGIPNAAAKADAIIALETKIAQAHWTPERSRDVEQTNNPMSLEKLQAFAPQFPWGPMMARSGLAAPPKIRVRQTTEISTAGALLASTPLNVWKDYLAYHFVRTHAQYLPHAFDQANFDFFSHTLRDVPVQRERWKRGVELVNRDLGEEVGRIYVAEHFPPEAERQATELVANLRAAYGERFQASAWMDEATRKAALVKLSTFDPRLGHPKTYIDYSDLKISRTDLLGDAVRSEQFEWALQLKRFPKPVDKSLWNMVPQEVNAYYSPLTNQITFPAAILQPPYFDPAPTRRSTMAARAG